MLAVPFSIENNIAVPVELKIYKKGVPYLPFQNIKSLNMIAGMI